MDVFDRLLLVQQRQIETLGWAVTGVVPVPGTAFARYGADRVRLAQIVWPCPHHRFPWQDGYCHPVELQPLLTRP